jgi:hypothetical protein
MKLTGRRDTTRNPWGIKKMKKRKTRPEKGTVSLSVDVVSKKYVQ